MALSGKFRFRKGAFGNLVLQVEILRKSWWGREKLTWRNAKAIDLAAPELRLLIDLSNGRTLVPLSRAVVPLRPEGLGIGDVNAPSVSEQRQPSSSAVH